MAEREIKVVISAADEYSKSFAKFKTDTQGVESSVTSSAGKMESGWKSSMDGIKNAWLGIAAVVGATAWLQSAAADALEAETNLNKLRIQLEGIGKTYNSTVQNAVTAASNYARVQDDEVNKTLQELIFITGDADKSLKNLNITYDLAYQKGISTSEAASLIGKAMTGNIEPLGRYILEFKNLNEKLGENATEAEKAAYAMAVLEEKTNGALSQMTDHEKKVRELTNAYKDLKQGIGEAVLEFGSWVLLEATFAGPRKNLEELSRAVGNLIDSLRYGTKAVQEMDAAIDTQIKLDEFSERAVTLVGNAHKKTAEEIRAHTKALSDLKKHGAEIEIDTSVLTQSTSLTDIMDSFAAGLSDFKLSDELQAPLESLGGIWGGYLAAGAKTSFETIMATTSINTMFDSALSEHSRYAAQMIESEQNLQQTLLSMKLTAANQAITLMSFVLGESKAAQIAAIAMEKALAIAQVFIQTQVAASAALAPPPLGLGPVLGAPLAASVLSWGNIQMGLIAATGLAEAASVGSSSPSAGISSGDITDISSTSSSSLVAESSSSGSTQNITINIQNGSGSGEYWQDVVENNIIPAINDVSDRNVEITINRA